MRRVVVFPQPLGPTSTIVCPAGISRLSAFRAGAADPGYRFVTRSKLIKEMASSVLRVSALGVDSPGVASGLILRCPVVPPDALAVRSGA